MRAGVEGRTPFADVRVMELAESLPLGWKLRSGDAGLTTKAVLRDAFASDVPAGILRRPKASFPLPFQAWVGDSVSVLGRSEFIREIVSPAVVQQVMEHPRELWHVAWPLVNLAMWRG
jgi:asparagine synthase (glutamine-hydrolysing)